MAWPVAVEPPFDFEQSLRFVCQPPRAAAHLDLLPVADYWCGREYRRLIALPARPVLARIRNQGTVDRPRMEVEAEPADLRPAEGEDLRRRTAQMLSASVRLEEYYRLARRDPVLRELTDRFYGLKVIRSPSLYESLVSAVLEQQLNFGFAATVKRRLAANFGPALVFAGQRYHTFPTPPTLAALQPSDLRPLQVSERKAKFLIGMAARAQAGELADGALAALPAAAVFERLQALRGVGRWTAEYVLLRGLGHGDALPADDAGLQKTVGRLYGLRGNASALAIRRRWRSLAPWRGYAAYYCWFTQWV